MSQRLYRHGGGGLLRAARSPLHEAPGRWPDLSDQGDLAAWRGWLVEVWSREQTAEAVALASPSLARRVTEICAGACTGPKEVRRAVVSLARYLLRETGRPTPFGLFAGVAQVGFGPAASVRWGREHRPVAGADGQWLADVIAGLEGCPELLERLPVVVSSLRTVRGGRLVLPEAARVEIRHTPAVRAVERIVAAPVRFGAAVAALAAEFPTAPEVTIRRMLTELVTQGFLVTSLRAPATVTEPLAHLVHQLHQMRADEVPAVAATVRELAAVAKELNNHNTATGGDGDRAQVPVIRRMRRLSKAGRSPISVDLHLDCDLTLPMQVAGEMEAAASTLLHLSAQPGGLPAWRDFFAAFVETYGTGTLVPVREVVDPDIGLGFPATYPGSALDPPTPTGLSARDDRLLALVQQATMDGAGTEIVLNEAMVRDLSVADLDPARIPPHVELTARIHAESAEALERGEFTLTVVPARAAGTMTGRFTTNTSSGLAEAFRRLPTSDADAIMAQLSVPPLYPHAENISRTPRFLDHIISLGEHRSTDDDGAIGLDDLAIAADRHRLRLVSMSRGRPVEPQVFHALRLDKQLPTLARFLVNLPRSHTATYTEFDWGAAAGLPYLPRVRNGRSVLSPARWQIRAAELPDRRAAWAAWRDGLARWAQRWRLPDTVELRDGDRVLRLDLTEPAHAALLRLQVQRAGEAVLTEAADPAGCGWLGGHAHQLAITLLADRQVATSALSGASLPVHIRSREYGQLPAAPQTQWLFAKLYVHPERQTEVIAGCVPRLLAHLDQDRLWWFLRYRSAHEPDHLRLRLQVRDPGDYSACAATIGAWAADLREQGVSRRLVLDTYYPELGRYGDGPTLAAAEMAFAADSHAVLTQLRHIPQRAAHPVALVVANLVDIACGFTGGTEPGMAWLSAHTYDRRPAPAPIPVRDQAVALADPSSGFAALLELPGGEELAGSWARRRAALDGYRLQLSDTADRDATLASLLHMHHIRAVGVDRDSERMCRRLARTAALRWQTRNGRR